MDRVSSRGVWVVGCMGGGSAWVDRVVWIVWM